MNTSRKITLCLLALALALSGCISGGNLTVSSACSAGAVSSGFTALWSSWQAISFLAASTVFVVSILVYVLGYAINHPKAIIWAKDQMQEAVVAMVITVFVIGIVSFLCTIDLKTLGLDTTCVEPNCDLMGTAFGYLSSTYATIMQGYFLVIGINSALTAAATLTIGFAPGGIGPIFSPFAFLADVANSLLLASIALMTGALLTLTQMVLLKMTAALFVILFPIGVILRSLGATRGFGGGLIAIALGFLLMYPLLVVLFYGALSNDLSSNYNDLNGSFKNAGLSPTDVNWFGGGILGFLAGFIGKTIMGAIFIPLIMFMVLIAFVKGLSMALGEEVDVSNLTRLI